MRGLGEIAAEHTPFLTARGRFYVATWFPGARPGGPGTVVAQLGRGGDRAGLRGGCHELHPRGVALRSPLPQRGSRRLGRGNRAGATGRKGHRSGRARVGAGTAGAPPSPRLSSGLLSARLGSGRIYRLCEACRDSGRAAPASAASPRPGLGCQRRPPAGPQRWSLRCPSRKADSVGPVRPDLENRGFNTLSVHVSQKCKGANEGSMDFTCCSGAGSEGTSFPNQKSEGKAKINLK